MTKSTIPSMYKKQWNLIYINKSVAADVILETIIWANLYSTYDNLINAKIYSESEQNIWPSLMINNYNNYMELMS